MARHDIVTINTNTGTVPGLILEQRDEDGNIALHDGQVTEVDALVLGQTNALRTYTVGGPDEPEFDFADSLSIFSFVGNQVEVDPGGLYYVDFTEGSVLYNFGDIFRDDENDNELYYEDGGIYNIVFLVGIFGDSTDGGGRSLFHNTYGTTPDQGLPYPVQTLEVTSAVTAQPFYGMSYGGSTFISPGVKNAFGFAHTSDDPITIQPIVQSIRIRDLP